MADRRVELYLFGCIANWIRHCHPGLAALEQPQFPDFGRSQGEKLRQIARWLDAELERSPSLPAPVSLSPTSPPSAPSSSPAA
jgi:hypothetical protein